MTDLSRMVDSIARPVDFDAFHAALHSPPGLDRYMKPQHRRPLPVLCALSPDEAKAARAMAWRTWKLWPSYPVASEDELRRRYDVECEAITIAERRWHSERSISLNSRQPTTRERLAARDGEDCWYCGKSLGLDRTIEHLHPQLLGGTDDDDNLVLAHRLCNQAVGSLPLAAKIAARNAIQFEQMEDRDV